MPFYEYDCKKCGVEFEIFHSIKESPKVICPDCKSSRVRKLVSVCGMIINSTGAKRRVQDYLRRESEAKQDLIENYGVEKVQPIGGNSFSSVYNDIKSRGSAVRDQMQAKREQNERKSTNKRREWAKKANKRVPARTQVRKEKKAQEESKKRAIRLNT